MDATEPRAGNSRTGYQLARIPHPDLGFLLELGAAVEGVTPAIMLPFDWPTREGHSTDSGLAMAEADGFHLAVLLASPGRGSNPEADRPESALAFGANRRHRFAKGSGRAPSNGWHVVGDR